MFTPSQCDAPDFSVVVGGSGVDESSIGAAYGYLVADVLARFASLDGSCTQLVIATGPWGSEAITRHLSFKDDIATDEDPDALPDALGVTPDLDVHTTDFELVRACQALWTALEARGDIYLGTYSSWYAVNDDTFYATSDTHMIGTVRTACQSDSPVEWTTVPSYYFRLTAYREALLDFYSRPPGFCRPPWHAPNSSPHSADLEDLPLSRPLSNWGIPVPSDSAHVMSEYVLSFARFLVAMGYPSTEADHSCIIWRTESQSGENTAPHITMSWPALLMSAGISFPRQVVIDNGPSTESKLPSPLTLISNHGSDAVRYHLLREIGRGQNSLSNRAIAACANAELTYGLDDLAYRTLSLIAKHCGGRIPAPTSVTDKDLRLTDQARGLLGKCREHLETLDISLAVDILWSMTVEATEYSNTERPWALRKTDTERMNTVLYTLVDVLRTIAIVMQPMIPNGAARLLDHMAVEHRNFETLANRLPSGTEIPEPKRIFRRYRRRAAKTHPTGSQASAT